MRATLAIISRRLNKNVATLLSADVFFLFHAAYFFLCVCAGTNRLSRVAGRDVVLRCVYNATIFTVFGLIERSCVKIWHDNGW